ncbi:MAG: hypothetical protein IT368_17085 [Candidatus Hydrogenedentes bacterium]|nr:hypothetical protein [Candidatus Hydrogenedentota bacterium]
MARIALYINDLAQRLTMKTLLEADGHTMVAEAPDLAVFDQPQAAAEAAESVPAVLLAPGHLSEDAVRALAQGVRHVIHVPLVPGEATLVVRRVAEQDGGAGPSGNGAGWPSMDQVEREHILNTIRHCKSNYTRAAKLLGIGRNTLWRKLNRYRMEGHLPPSDEPPE